MGTVFSPKNDPLFPGHPGIQPYSYSFIGLGDEIFVFLGSTDILLLKFKRTGQSVIWPFSPRTAYAATL